MATIEKLKQEATELGISFNQNIGVDKLQAKIDEFYKSQETSGNEILAAVAKQEAMEKSEEKSAVSGKQVSSVSENTLNKYIREAEVAAKKTRVVIITDNDQRENNQTTVAVVNCSNIYFDLGTAYIPLNVPVEVKVGHLNVLKETEIPLHMKDPKTGLNSLSMRPRYSISYQD